MNALAIGQVRTHRMSVEGMRMRKRRDDDRPSIEELKSQVVEYIPTKHGRIGIIPPSRMATKEELDDLYRVIAKGIISTVKGATKL